VTMTNENGAVRTDSVQGADAEHLRARLKAIEEQPLNARADDYARVHAELQSLLEGSDTGDNRG
jgi:hypothetical protein